MKDDPAPPPVAHLELKAALLVALMLALVAGAVLYVLYARGVFEATQKLVLVAENSEGVIVGMDMTFSGFPIGRVRTVELGADGQARIVIDVPRRDAHWLRTTSVFTLVRGLVGNTSLRAYTGVPADPPLPDGAERPVLIGDATAEIPKLVTAARELVQNLSALAAADAPLARALGNLEATSARLNGPRGALGVVFGNDADARKLVQALDRSNALLARVEQAVGRADAQFFGSDGLVPAARDGVAQLNAALVEARATLQRVDALLRETQGIAANLREGTADLGALRAEVEASLRKVERLIDELNRKWPFAPKPGAAELRLP